MDADTWLEQFERLGARENMSIQKYLDLQYCLKGTGNAGICFSTEAVNNPDIKDCKTPKEAARKPYSHQMKTRSKAHEERQNLEG